MAGLTRVWVLCLAFALPATAAAVDVEDYPELAGFIQELAERHKFSAAELKRLFACARIRPEIVEAIERPREALPWYEYRKIFLTDEHARNGRQYWDRHAPALERAHAQYGVPPEIIVGILGVETQYGRNKGEYPVLDALTTLALEYPPRAGFFKRELEEFLLLARELGWDARRIKGSYAGAIGVPQFLPSSYRRYAVDFDGDRRRDILGSAEDTIGSVANYLKLHGWEANAPVSEEVKLEGTLYFWIEKLGVKPVLSIADLIQYGVFPSRFNDADARAALIVLEGETGPVHRLGYNNFYVITRYNRSKRYAMAVVELGETVRKRREEGS